MDIIARKKNNSLKGGTNAALNSDNENDELEVSGTETTKKPLVTFGDEETDMDLINQLYFKPRHKPLMGEFAQKWDQD
jgi:hypothetical protein